MRKTPKQMLYAAAYELGINRNSDAFRQFRSDVVHRQAISNLSVVDAIKFETIKRQKR